MNVLGQRTGSRFVVPLAAGGVCLIGIIGGATAANLTTGPVPESAELVSSPGLLQGGLKPSPSAEPRRSALKAPPASTSVAATPAGDEAIRRPSSIPHLGVGPAARAAPVPPAKLSAAAPPAEAANPRRQAAPTAQGPEPTAPPAPATVPLPGVAPPIELQLIPLKPQTPVEPKQLRIG